MDILTITIGAVLLFLFPLGDILTIFLGTGIRINPLDVGVSLITLVGIISFLSQKKRIPMFFFSIGLFFITCILSLVINSILLKQRELLVAILYFLRFVVYVGSMFTVWQIARKKQIKILYFLFAAGCLLLVTGYVQYFFFPSLRGLTYEGWDPHLYRMFGTFLDPNFFGSFLVLFTLLSLFFVLQKTKYTYFFIAVTLLSIFGLFLTFSRSAYIALAIGVVTFLFCKGYKTKILQSIFVLLLIGSVVVLLLAKQSEGTNLLRTASTAARFHNLFRATAIIQDSPFFGVGFDAYKYAQHRKGFIGGVGWEDSHSSNGVNNSYLFVWATTGIIGLIAYLFFLKKLFFLSWKEKTVGALVFSSLAALCVNSLFENSLFYPFLLLWMCLLAGLIANSEQ